MRRRIRTLLFGEPLECKAVGEALSALDAFLNHEHAYHHVYDLEEFEQALAEWHPTLTVVLADGAAGLESVYRSRQRRPSLPVFWFSNDREFGMQSYRLDCAYFSTKPVTPEKLTMAVQRCQHTGFSYDAH